LTATRRRWAFDFNGTNRSHKAGVGREVVFDELHNAEHSWSWLEELQYEIFSIRSTLQSSLAYTVEPAVNIILSTTLVFVLQMEGTGAFVNHQMVLMVVVLHCSLRLNVTYSGQKKVGQ